jgi:hypothetical protein
MQFEKYADLKYVNTKKATLMTYNDHRRFDDENYFFNYILNDDSKEEDWIYNDVKKHLDVEYKHEKQYQGYIYFNYDKKTKIFKIHSVSMLERSKMSEELLKDVYLIHNKKTFLNKIKRVLKEHKVENKEDDYIVHYKKDDIFKIIMIEFNSRVFGKDELNKEFNMNTLPEYKFKFQYQNYTCISED